MSASCLDVVAEFDEHWASQAYMCIYTCMQRCMCSPAQAPCTPPSRLPSPPPLRRLVASQIRQRKFQMHNKEWLEVIDEDEAEEYEDAVELTTN